MGPGCQQQAGLGADGSPGVYRHVGAVAVFRQTRRLGEAGILVSFRVALFSTIFRVSLPPARQKRDAALHHRDGGDLQRAQRLDAGRMDFLYLA